MAQITLGPNRAYPALPTVGNDLESHSRALEAIVEAIQIHERRTGDTLDSFVRVGELATLGLVTIDGRIVSDNPTEESTTHHHDSTYLRLDGSNDPITGSVSFQDGITVAGAIDVTSATFTGLSSDDLADVASIAMLDEAEVVTGQWNFSGQPTFFSGLGSGNIKIGRDAFQYYEIQVQDGICVHNYVQDESDTTNHSVYWSINSPGTGLKSYSWQISGGEKMGLDKNGNLTVTGDVSGVTIGGITEANLVDKSAVETIAGAWTFTPRVVLTAGFQMPDSSAYIWNLTGATTWGQYWNTTTNAVEFHAAGAANIILDLDAGSIFANTDIQLGNQLGDRIGVYGTLDVATSYGIGIEASTMYYKSNTYHRWYVGTNADAGVSDKMQLSASALDVMVNSNFYAGVDVSSNSNLIVLGGSTYQYDDAIDDYLLMDFGTTSYNWTFKDADEIWQIANMGQMNVVAGAGRDLALMNNFAFIPKGYIKYNSVDFRFDASDTAWCLDRLAGATYSVTTGTDPGSTAIKALFGYTNSYINLNTYKDVSNNWTLEVTGFSLSNSSNTNWKPYVLFHSAGANAGNLLIEFLEGDGTTWTTVYNGAARDVINPTSYTVFTTGILKGMRFTFTGITGNSYLKMIGATSITSPSFQWQALRSGAEFYGTISGKVSNVQYWSIAATGAASFSGNVDALAGLDVTGNITVTGTVDGIDIAGLDAAVAKTADNETITGTWTLDGSVTESDFGTGGKVKDGTDVARPIGFNVAPVYEIDVDDTFDLAHVGMIWNKDSGIATTLTCANDATIPQGAMWFVMNNDIEDITIAQGTGVTIYWMEGGAGATAGNFAVKTGGIVTIYKYSDTVFWAWGTKEPTSVVVTLDGLSDVVITAAASGDFLRFNGTNWVDSVIQNSDISAAMVTQHVGSIDHDALLNFVANEHIDWTSTASNFNTSGSVTANSFVLGDNEQIILGASNDVVISYDSVADSLDIDMLSTVDFNVVAGVTTLISAVAGGAVTLYQNGNVKFNTTSTGANVTGNLTVTGTVDGVDIAALEAAVAKTADNETITGTWTLDGSVTESDFGTGGKVKDGSDVARPIGFNVAPIFEQDANDSFDLAHVGYLWHKDLGAAVTYTCDNDATIPAGAMWFVYNEDSEDLTIAQGTGVTIYWLEAGAAPASGNVTVKQGGIVTVYKYTDTVFWAWGSKEAGAAVTTLAGLSDVTITAAASGDFLRHNGTNWVDSVIQNSDITAAMVTQHVGSIDHDALLNFVANEHIDWTSASSNFSTTGSLASGVATITNGAQTLNLKAGATADHVYMAWYADSAAQSTRSAYMGFGSAGSNDLYIVNEQGSNIFLTGNVNVSSGLDVTGNITVTGTVDGVDIATRDAFLTTLDGAAAKTADTETITGTWTLDGSVTESDFGTGGKVKDGTDVARPIGFNVAPIYEIDANDSFDLAHVGMLWHKDLNAAVTYTCDNDATIPVGAMWFVFNDDTEDLTIAQGTGVTIYWLEAGAAPASGNVTVKQGGIVTVFKYTDTVFWAWGSKEAGSGVSTLAGLNDVTITAAASGDYLRHNGTNWVDATGVATADVQAGNLGSGVLPYSTAVATASAFAIPFLNTTGAASGNFGLQLDSGGGFTYNPSTNTLVAGVFSGSGASLTSIPETAITDGSVLARIASSETISGTWTFSQDLTITGGSLFLTEGSAAAGDVAGRGQLWVLNQTPNYLMFTDDAGTDKYVGMGQYTLIANQTFDMNTAGNAEKCPNGAWYSDNATAYTLTLENSTGTDFPVGSQMTVWNEGSGTLTINEGTSTTLYLLTGSAVTDTAGGCTMAQGGYATIIRKSATVYLIMGAGLTA